jgi:hypothetical protein
MKYSEWVMKHGPIDHHVKGHLSNDVGDMTDREILETFGHKIKQAAEELGIDVDENDLYDIIDRIYGTPDMPPFHRSHYDLHS